MLLKSTIGKKIIVAVTGLVLVGFVLTHLLGNLQIFLGPAAINDYSAYLRGQPKLLWLARFVLIISAFLHVLFTLQLARLNRAARPEGYAQFNPSRSTPASRTMVWGGIVVLLYIIYHVLHLTTGTVHPQFDAHNIYANLITGLSVWYVSAFYIVANVALGFHLYHGIWSVFQTLGLNHPRYNAWRRTLATVTAYGVTLGYISIPIAILAGVIK